MLTSSSNKVSARQPARGRLSHHHAIGSAAMGSTAATKRAGELTPPHHMAYDEVADTYGIDEKRQLD